MEREDIEERAYQNFLSGFHCAEAILKAFVELYGKSPDPSIIKVASGFGGGIGESLCEACGALTGGVIALGWLYGRNVPSDDKKRISALTAEFRTRFIEKFGATNCKKILDLLGNQENGLKCKKLTADAAGILYEILEKEKALSGQ